MEAKNNLLYCLDVGNTMTEIAIVENCNVVYKKHISTQSIKDDHKTIKLLFETKHLQDIANNKNSNVMASSVVPEINENLRTYFKLMGFNDVVFIKDDVLPIKCDFKKTGADIIAKSFYLDSLKKESALILDVGTATVMQYVNNKSIEKVAITIGFGTIYSALHAKTSLLPLITPERVENVLQNNTVASIKSGTYWGYVGLLNMFIKKAKQELNSKKFDIFLTGGLSKLLVKDLDFDFKHDPDIIFKSLSYIYNEVVRKG